MDEKQYKELVEKLGKEAADQIKAKAEEIEKKLNEKYEEKMKGLITDKEFNELKEELKKTDLTDINDKLAKLDEISKKQGDIINGMKETGGKPASKSLEQYLIEQMPKLKELQKKGGFIEVTGAELKAAGVTSISGSVSAMDAPPNSPYLPGIGGPELEMFDIVQNPNFIISRVDVGRTNQSKLAWINEVSVDGEYTASGTVAEAGLKPLTQHKFKVEISEAKKAAAYIELTEEFEDDVPGLATQVRRMLRDDVIRSFDDKIQTDVQNAARQYEISGLEDDIQAANLYDAIGALIAQVGEYNYVPNTIALHPTTEWKILMQKDSEDRYLQPPFLNRIIPLIVSATKMTKGKALVGDLSQYKVDIYKDFVLKMGWINDNLIYNKFCIVGEMRYHSYISDNRKKAIVYDSLHEVMVDIDGTPGSV